MYKIAFEGIDGCQPLELTKILMADFSWKLLKDIKVGDLIVSPQLNGESMVVPITKIENKGIKEVLRVEDKNGRGCYATENHIFPSYNKLNQLKDRKLSEIKVSDKHPNLRYSLIRGSYKTNDIKLPIDSWLMGFILGDGCCCNHTVRIDKPDIECYNNVKSIHKNTNICKNSKNILSYSLLGITNTIRKLGLYGVKSINKKIPDIYLKSGYNQRLELLAGLLDSDGNKDGKYGFSYDFSSSSEKLIWDVYNLTLLLGIEVTKPKKRIVTNQSKKKFISYRIHIQSNFRIPTVSKRYETTKSRCREVNHNKIPISYKNIIGEYEVVDITVDSPSHLYISDDGIITHNSGKSRQANMMFNLLTIKYPENKVILLNEPRILRKEILETCEHIGEEVDGLQFNDAYLSYIFGKDGHYNRKEELESNPDILIRDRDTTVSQYAYHHNFGTQDEFIYSISWHINQINNLDLLIFIDVPIDIAVERIQKRSSVKKIVNYFEKKEKLIQVRENYLQLLKNKDKLIMSGLKDTKIVIISGDGEIQDIHKNISSIIDDNLRLR